MPLVTTLQKAKPMVGCTATCRYADPKLTQRPWANCDPRCVTQSEARRTQPLVVGKLYEMPSPLTNILPLHVTHGLWNMMLKPPMGRTVGPVIAHSVWDPEPRNRDPLRMAKELGHPVLKTRDQ